MYFKIQNLLYICSPFGGEVDWMPIEDLSKTDVKILPFKGDIEMQAWWPRSCREVAS
jgi:hypothetical protein